MNRWVTTNEIAGWAAQRGFSNLRLFSKEDL